MLLKKVAISNCKYQPFSARSCPARSADRLLCTCRINPCSLSTAVCVPRPLRLEWQSWINTGSHSFSNCGTKKWCTTRSEKSGAWISRVLGRCVTKQVVRRGCQVKQRSPSVVGASAWASAAKPSIQRDSKANWL